MVKYQVRDDNHDVALGIFETLPEALLAAARSDMFGACFQRDDEGLMRFYSSKSSIGNNPYIPQPDEAWDFFSSNADDKAAIDELSEAIYGKGWFHNRDEAICVVKLDIKDNKLLGVDGKSMADLLKAYEEMSDETISAEEMTAKYLPEPI